MSSQADSIYHEAHYIDITFEIINQIISKDLYWWYIFSYVINVTARLSISTVYRILELFTQVYFNWIVNEN